PEMGSSGSDSNVMTAAHLTGESKVLGTAAYMSPEQAEGHAVDLRSDVFSLGVVLYEMATGQRPFKGDSALSVISSILKDTPAPATTVNPNVPSDLDRVLRHCLAKDPSRRYQSAVDLRNDLEDLVQSPLDGRRTVSRPGLVWIAGGVVLAVAVGVGAW